MGKTKLSPSGVAIHPAGFLSYRGHLIECALVSHGDAGRSWRVEIKPIGLDHVTVPLTMIERPFTETTLDLLVNDAKAVVNHLISEGINGPAATIPENHMVGKPADALVMRSKTGKVSICDAHWNEMKRLARLGQLDLIVAQVLLFKTFVARLYVDGLVVRENALHDPYTVNMLLDSYAPLCCWVGADELASMLAVANPSRLLDKAREKGLL